MAVCNNFFVKTSRGNMMKRRFFYVLVLCVLSMYLWACSKKPEAPAEPQITQLNADDYIVELGQYKDFTVTTQKLEATDANISKYTDIFYENLAKDNENLKDENGTILPLTDASVELLSSTAYSTVKEFMLFVKELLPEYLDEKYEREVFEESMAKAIATTTFNDIPKSARVAKEAQVAAFYSEFAESYSVKLEKYLRLIGSSMEKECEKLVKRELIIKKIAQIENITPNAGETLEDAVKSFLVSQLN